jgi:hypothetical protein
MPSQDDRSDTTHPARVGDEVFNGFADLLDKDEINNNLRNTGLACK